MTVQAERAAGVPTLRLNRPERLNAIAARLAGFDPAVARPYKRALHEIGFDRYERALDLDARMQGEIEALKPQRTAS